MTGYHYDPMLWPTLGSATFIGALGLAFWRRRADTKGAATLALLAFLLVVWCLAGAAESAATDFPTQRAWFIFRDALTLPGVVVALWFALQYAGLKRWLTRPVGAVLTVLVVAYIALGYVDDGRLVWSSIVWDHEVQGDRTLLGLAFAAIALLLFLLATAAFLLLFVRSPAHRVPVALILLGQVVLRVIYPMVVFDVVYLPSIVSGVFAVDFGALMYAIALFRFRLFDLVPVARQTIVERMPDAMLVLDTKGHTVDTNAAARRLLGAPGGAATPVHDFVASRPELAAAVTSSGEQPSEVVLETAQGQRTCQVGVTGLSDWQGLPIGRLVVLHDITELRRAEERLLGQERALTAARERERLARDLHDSLGQVLGYLGLQAAAIRKLISDGKVAEVDDRLGRVAVIAGNAQSDVRRTIAELSRSPEQAVTFVDFVATLRTRLDAARRDYAIATSFTIRGSAEGSEVPPDVAAHLLRIVDESIRNAMRHGQAREARVSLERDDASVRLSIEDDGVGFETDVAFAESDGRYGLRFMRERAAELGGQLDLVSAPGRGTRVAIQVPLRDRRAVAP